jgi:hypothetical protein
MGCQPEQFDVVVYDILQFLVNIMKKKASPIRRAVAGKPQQDPRRPGADENVAGHRRHDGV